MSTSQLANCLRFLAIDAIEKSNSGHPGMPMGMADVVSVLFNEFLQFNPKDPKWPNRDRFILSAGHGSMLLYALLYLTDYEDISIEDIKRFRQLHSKCAGHPEFGELAGIETTTGPLGQGLANAVGMAISEKMLKNRFGREIFDHKIYALVGDGCLMEGISQEALSIAGHLQLNNLVVLWDNNSISIDGKTSLATSENMHLRFEALGFDVISIDGHNFDEIRAALKKVQNITKPTLIDCKTIIGFGSPNKAGTAKIHGSPLGADEANQTREKLNWQFSPFEIPAELLNEWRKSASRCLRAYQSWQDNFLKLDEAGKTRLNEIINKKLPNDFAEKFAEFEKKIIDQKANLATRKSSQITLEFLTENLPNLIGGSADLTESVLTKTPSTSSISASDFSGRYLHYGVREHAMAAIMNGLSLHGNFIPYGGTFLVFADYLKPAIRLSALMKQQAIYVLTHDSIGLGEDGPTHQPVEHLAMLRSIPNLLVFRPCDSEETTSAYKIAILSTNQPSALALSRQNLPFLEKFYQKFPEKNQGLALQFAGTPAQGGYIISESKNCREFLEKNLNSSVADLTKAFENFAIDAIIFASGSEVQIAIESQKILENSGLNIRVISIPSFEIFSNQSEAYKNHILGRNLNKNSIEKKPIKIAVEAAIRMGWERFIGEDGIFIGMNSFGGSAPAKDLFTNFGITAENITQKITEKL